MATTHTQLLIWVLGIWTRVLRLVQQALLSTEPSPPLHGLYLNNQRAYMLLLGPPKPALCSLLQSSDWSLQWAASCVVGTVLGKSRETSRSWKTAACARLHLTASFIGCNVCIPISLRNLSNVSLPPLPSGTKQCGQKCWRCSSFFLLSGALPAPWIKNGVPFVCCLVVSLEHLSVGSLWGQS